MFDLIIRNASVIDGTGADARTADIGVVGDRIAAIGPIPLETRAGRTIDAAGRTVSPGFIDIHTHSDLWLMADGTGESKLRQGVTTEVVGNCSFAAFPLEPTRLDLHTDHLARSGATLTPLWDDFTGYAAALENQGLAINVASLAGHGTLRVAAMGVEQRPPTPDELARMQRDLAVALDQGAFGMSTGLTHVPSAYADFDEVAALADVLAARGALYATHSRSSSPERMGGIEEAIALGRQTGVTVEYSHIAINRPSQWGRAAELLAELDAARDDGVEIFFDVYPYHASSSALTQHLPPWVQAGGTEAMRRRLADPDERQRALTDMHDGWFGGIPWLWDRFVLSDVPDGVGEGISIEERSRQTGIEPYELTLQLCERYGNRIRIVLFYRTEEDVAVFLAHPMAIIGSDGNAIPLDRGGVRPHPRSFGTFPRVLGRFTRQLGVLTLTEAVRKMTGEPARRLGITDRGTIAEGSFADLVMFDPDTVDDNAEFGAAPHPPDGIDLVVVNGVVVLDHGTITRSRPGVVLKRSA